MFNKIIEFLKYPSTAQGAVGVLALIGVNLSPEHTTAILQATAGVIAVIAIFFSDSDVKKD